MRGIVGYLNLNSQPLDPQQPVLDRMCQSIRHRGADEQGTKQIGPAALGMTRWIKRGTKQMIMFELFTNGIKLMTRKAADGESASCGGL